MARARGNCAWRVILSPLFLLLSLSLSLFRAWRSGEIKQASFATKRPVGRKKKPDWAFLPCRDILYLDAYSTKGKNRLLLARSLRRLISSLSGRGKIYGGCLVSFLFRFDRKREREKIEDFRRWFHIFIIVSFRGKYNLQLQSVFLEYLY